MSPSLESWTRKHSCRNCDSLACSGYSPVLLLGADQPLKLYLYICFLAILVAVFPFANILIPRPFQKNQLFCFFFFLRSFSLLVWLGDSSSLRIHVRLLVAFLLSLVVSLLSSLSLASCKLFSKKWWAFWDSILFEVCYFLIFTSKVQQFIEWQQIKGDFPHFLHLWGDEVLLAVFLCCVRAWETNPSVSSPIKINGVMCVGCFVAT